MVKSVHADNAKTSYMYSLGDGSGKIDAPMRVYLQYHSAATVEQYYAPGSRRGLFHYEDWKSFASCLDGTSNTVAISEAVTNLDGYTDLRVKGGLIGDWTTFSPTDLYVLGSVCLNNAFSASDRTQLQYGSDSWRTHFYQDGRTWNGFHTILPPNSPSCMGNGAQAAYAASSYHSGGVNASMLDGAVRFISETINSGNPATPMPFDGSPSPYGVWGALGTPACGENASL
jgi:prepilin-type processing-associated H-X9-DG protein